jgi:hypothetical protein
MEADGTKQSLRISESIETQRGVFDTVKSFFSYRAWGWRVTSTLTLELFSSIQYNCPGRSNVINSLKQTNTIKAGRSWHLVSTENILNQHFFGRTKVLVVSRAWTKPGLVFPRSNASSSLYILLGIQRNVTLLVLYTIWNFGMIAPRLCASYQSSFAFEDCVMPKHHRMSHCNSSTPTTIVQPHFSTAIMKVG